MSDLIEAVSRQCKTMADGTLRITIDVSPIHARDAFGLFGAPDVPMVLGRLVMDHERNPEPVEPVEMKGGPLAKLAGMWCNDRYFIEWVKSKSERAPDEFIKNICGIDSKRELDHDDVAALLFHEEIRKPYAAWLERNGRAA